MNCRLSVRQRDRYEGAGYVMSQQTTWYFDTNLCDFVVETGWAENDYGNFDFSLSLITWWLDPILKKSSIITLNKLGHLCVCFCYI